MAKEHLMLNLAPVSIPATHARVVHSAIANDDAHTVPWCRSPTSQACYRCSPIERTCKSGRPPGAGAFPKLVMPCPRCVRRPAESASPILPGEFLDLLLSPSGARAGAQPRRGQPRGGSLAAVRDIWDGSHAY